MAVKIKNKTLYWLLGGLLAGLFAVVANAGQKSATVPQNRQIFTNRQPLEKIPFYPPPLGAIKPRGWLKRQLQIQADGVTGKIDEFWKDLDSNSGWLGGSGEDRERGP